MDLDSSEPETLGEIPITLVDLVDQACDRFEKQWRAGEAPRIEAFLAEAPEQARPALRRELLLLELDIIRREGRRPIAADYLTRFPDLAKFIDEAFPVDASSAIELSIATEESREAQGKRRSISKLRQPDLPGYVILNEVGQGGMGVVYRAKEVRLNRIVALKMILSGRYASPEQIARFQAEAEIVARLRHENVVRIHAVGEHDGLPYYEMEYVEGGSLSAKLDGTPQPAREAARLIESVARGVEAMHRLGVVHRDLKPGNILLTEDGTPKIGDFGLAKSLLGDEGLTRTDLIIGTPSYMAPEQASGHGKTAGPAADIHSLGAILYELLCGRPPFRGATAIETIEQVRSSEPVAPSRLVPRLPRDIETIALKCLQKEPSRRYATADDLARDLRRFLDGETILARPAGNGERLARWCRRNPVIAGLAAAFVLASMIGTGGIAWAWRRAEHDREVAVKAESLAIKAQQVAERRAARLALEEGMKICEDGEVDRGLLWLVRGLELAERSQSRDLESSLKLNLGEWSEQLVQPGPTLPHLEPCNALRFDKDGKLVVASDDGFIRHWDFDTGKQIGPPLRHPNALPILSNPKIFNIALSPDGKALAIGTTDSTAKIWDNKLAGAMARPRHNLIHTSTNVWDVAYSPDGRTLLTGDDGGFGTLWDSSTGKRLFSLKHGDTVQSVAYHPSSEWVVTAGWDGLIKRWKVSDGSEMGPPLVHDRAKGRVLAAVFSPDGRFLATGGRNRAVLLWDAQTGERIGDPMLHNDTVTAIAFSPDGLILAAGADDGIVKFWETSTHRPTGQSLRHKPGVHSIAFHPNGDALAVAAGERGVRTWRLPRSRSIGLTHQLTYDLHTLAFNHDASQLLAAGKTVGAVLCDQRDGNLSLANPKTGTWTVAAALSGDSSVTATSNWKTTSIKPGVQRWKTATGERIGKDLPHIGTVTAMAFLPGDKSLLTCSNIPSAVYRWNLETETLDPGFSCEVPEIKTFALSKDGKTFLLAADRTARLHRADTGAPAGPSFQHADMILCVALSPDGKTAVSGSRDGLAIWWNLADGLPLTLPLRHAEAVNAVAFSPDGKTILTGSAGGSARFWDPATGSAIGPPIRHAGPVVAVAFAPDGKTVATASTDTTVRTWRVPARPLQGDANCIRLWVQEKTGLELDNTDNVRVIALDELESMKKRLEECVELR